MNYRLAVLTHGDGDVLDRTLASFRTHVRPLPTDAVLHADGMPAVVHSTPILGGYDEWPWRLSGRPEQEGFCEATRLLWRSAAHDLSPGWFVFWLEHDFVFDRPVDLVQLATVLAVRDDIAQVSLMRGAVNEREVAAGGLVASRPGEFVDRGGWLEHHSYFTTNPSLIRPDLMLRSFPPGPECEGVFGIELVDDGLGFGVWGDGSPWVTHIGQRAGHGY